MASRLVDAFDRTPRSAAHAPSRARAFTVAFLLIVATECGGIVALNVVVDPWGEFGTGLVPPLVVQDVPTKVQLYSALAQPPDVLVLGSSRVMTIDSPMVERAGHGRAFNFGLTSAVPPDAAAVYRFVQHRQGTPREVIYGVEPELLHPGESPKWAVRVSAPIAEANHDRPSFVEYAGQAVRTLLLPWHTLDALRALRAAALHEMDVRALSFHEDGHWTYDGAEAARAAGAFDLNATVNESSAVRDVLAMGAFPVDTTVVRELATDAAVHDATVYVFLTPQHPLARARLAASGEEAAHLAARAQLAAMCGPRVRAFDLTDIQTFDGDPDDFYDAFHYGPANAERIVRALYAGDGSLCA